MEHDALRRRKVNLAGEAADLTAALPDLCPEYENADLQRAYERRVAEDFGRAGIAAGGFRWLKRVFEAAPPECRKVLILRDTDRYTVELGVEYADWLRALQVSVHDYYLSHDAQTGRLLPVETFHAKLVVADETLAYVGSANLLSSSEGV